MRGLAKKKKRGPSFEQVFKGYSLYKVIPNPRTTAVMNFFCLLLLAKKKEEEEDDDMEDLKAWAMEAM